MHSDWLFQVSRLFLTNQSGLFQHSCPSLKIVYDISSRCWQLTIVSWLICTEIFGLNRRPPFRGEKCGQKIFLSSISSSCRFDSFPYLKNFEHKFRFLMVFFISFRIHLRLFHLCNGIEGFEPRAWRSYVTTVPNPLNWRLFYIVLYMNFNHPVEIIF